jgi:hypothetical protein
MNSNTQQQQETIMPPAPPVAEAGTFTPGEFAYADKWDREYLKDAYQVISRNEWWGPLRKALLARGVDARTGFQFTEDPLYKKIMNAISETYIGGGHSGSSIGATMRVMQTIALKGEAEYCRACIAYRAEQQRNREAMRIQRQLEEVRRQIEQEDSIIRMATQAQEQI